MSGPKRRTSRKPSRIYHHGDLRAALLSAAWSIVAEEGVEALTLRACARRAGVSHAAPQHHFGNVAGLMEEFAADGYERMGTVMDATAAECADRPLLAAGLGYVRFAEQYPEHFTIMSKVALTSAQSPRLRDASRATRRRLETSLQAAYVDIHGCELSAEESAARSVLAWCCVQGYAMLRTERRSNDTDFPDVSEILARLRPALLAV